MFFVPVSMQMKCCSACHEFHFMDEFCQEPTQEELIELEQEEVNMRESQETYTCDRCNGTTTLSFKLGCCYAEKPLGWTTIKIEGTSPSQDLCSNCNASFKNWFLRGELKGAGWDHV